MDSLELLKRIFTLGEKPFPIKSIAYHTDDSKLFSSVRDALHDDEYEELKESRFGVFLKFKEMDFGWASRFSLIEFEQLTGLNCEYIEHLENLRCEVTNEMSSFWERIGVSVDVGPSSEQIIRALKRCQEWSRDNRMRLGYLAIFSGFIEGRKYSSATRASLARLVMDLEKFKNYPWGRVVFKVVMDSLRAKDFTKSYTVDGFIQVLQVWIYHALPELGANYGNTLPNKPSPPLLAFKGGKGRKCFDDAISRQWTINCWEDEGIYLWTNPKTHVVYVKEESSLKSLVVREEDIERPSKRARIEAPAEPRSEDISDARSGAIPEARSEASIPVSGVDKAYIEKCFKDLTDVMRDGFGTCLKEMKLLGNRMDVVEKKLGITGKGTSSDDLQQTTSSLPKRGLEHGAKEAKANEAKANEAKTEEAKAKEGKAKEKEAKEKEEKETKLAAEALLGDANRRKRPKPKRLLIKKLGAFQRRILLWQLSREGVNEIRSLLPHSNLLFRGNSTAKLIIPNTKVGHGYDPFALPDKQLSKALTEHLKKYINWRKSFERKPKRCLSYWYQVIRTPLVWLLDTHMDAYINVLRLRQRNNPNHFRSERICFLDHLFSQCGGTSIVPTFCATIKILGVDIDDIYAPVNFQNDHWIAIWISIPKRHIVVWDNIVKHISKAQLDEVMEPFLTMVPYLLVECASTDEERIKYSLEPFTYEKPTVGVPQCIAGDCGVYALKYMECHALGYTLFPAAFCEKNVKHIWEKMAHDIFHETPGFEGIEDKTAYYNDLDTYG
ncbi:hypothetical protein N665_0071s0014 [Sinapis alba]|nr:hypothetical protein N665_0071s0014 [Sinapis alba]